MKNKREQFILTEKEWSCILDSSCSSGQKVPELFDRLGEIICEGKTVTREDGRILGYDVETLKFYDTFQYVKSRKNPYFIGRRLDGILLKIAVALIGYSVIKQLVIYLLWYYVPEEFRFAVEDLTTPPSILPKSDLF
ncbi:hypothetical protein [Dyadobacter psychrotolerans]|uniref:Uncharacterized protein n=1 Tax=Dyadobacter psychrotolerans TaxID=2541721 RepID=A0A4R5DUT1_9BACT|nr:hypothetical protein [Dyadobacter psychrotolerans]TDE14733.1 hypothetical protein E0F88_16230 [Dyadobacter psychrotolerans]